MSSIKKLFKKIMDSKNTTINKLKVVDENVS